MLLTYNQQQAIKPISKNNQYLYDQLANEVEQNELIDLLGLAFLQDLQDNPTTANNLLVLNGSTFTNELNQTVKFKGLRFTIAYLNYVKYLDNSDIADTFTGMVQKTRQETTSLAEGRIMRLQKNSREIALKEFENLKTYLDNNYTLYPLWVCDKSKSPYKPKLQTLRQTIRDNQEYPDINTNNTYR